MKYYYQMVTAMVDKIIKIKTQHKTLERIRTAKIIEGKTNKIPYKALEGIRTAKISNIYYILFFIIMK